MTTKIVYIDLDPAIYRAGFAGESISYEVIFEDDSENIHKFYFEPNMNQSAYDRLKKFLETHKDWTVLEKIKHVDIEPWVNVKQIFDVQVESIKKETREHYKLDRRDVSYVLILSGKGNYREQIATLKPYKGNRDPTHKPFYYDKLKELGKSYGAVVVDGREADDEISIRCWDMIRTGNPDGFVVATIDKDLDQIPGHHYDYMKKVFYEISETDAKMWFWQQVLSGDPTDNIGGACGIGPGKAAKIVQEMDINDPGLCWTFVLDTYAKAARKAGECYHSHYLPSEAALETARLVFLQTREGEQWEPPA